MSISQDQASLTHKQSNLKLLLKEAKKAKAAIASQFKQVEVGSEQHGHLITQMQESSADIKKIESALKEIERSLLTPIDTDLTAQNRSLPPLLTFSPAQTWAGDISIAELTSTEISEWHEFVHHQPKVTPYHLPAWAEIIERSFHNPTRVWVARNSDGDIIGGIPLTFFNSLLFGKFAVSIPYVNYGGVLTTYFNVAQSLMNHLMIVCQAEALSHIEVRTMQPGLTENSSSKKASMILQLPETSEVLDKNLGSKLRAQIKKCEEHKPEIQFGKIELLDDFYNVFAKNMRDLGTPVYTQSWFANILMDDRINSKLAVVYINKRAVSCGFLIGFKNMLEIPWASTVKEANVFNTNMWMYRQILDFAIENKFSFFDFGRSTQDAGTYKFKKQWGALPYEHYWYKILPHKNESAPELNPDNPKFALMIYVWKRLPVWFTKLIGPSIIRNIP